jgi:hypothetical protein
VQRQAVEGDQQGDISADPDSRRPLDQEDGGDDAEGP